MIAIVTATGLGALLAAIAFLVYIFVTKQGLGWLWTAAFSVLTLIQSFIFVDLWLSHRSIRKYYRQALKPVFFIGFLVPFISQFFIVSQASIAELFKVTVVPTHIFLSFVVFASSVLVVIKFVKKYLM